MIIAKMELGVEFYSSSNPGPLGKPSAKKISSYEDYLRNWDPTDPNSNNPWKSYKAPQKNETNTIKQEIQNTNKPTNTTEGTANKNEEKKPENTTSGTTNKNEINKPTNTTEGTANKNEEKKPENTTGSITSKNET